MQGLPILQLRLHGPETVRAESGALLIPGAYIALCPHLHRPHRLLGCRLPRNDGRIHADCVVACPGVHLLGSVVYGLGLGEDELQRVDPVLRGLEAGERCDGRGVRIQLFIGVNLWLCSGTVE